MPGYAVSRAMADYLLDTDVLIDFLKGGSDTVTVVRGLAEGGHRLCWCCVNVAELYSGLSEFQREKAAAFLQRLEYLDVGLEAAKLAGDFRYAFARAGKALGTTDALIAAAAITNGACLVTMNGAHFPMEGLRILEVARQQ